MRRTTNYNGDSTYMMKTMGISHEDINPSGVSTTALPATPTGTSRSVVHPRGRDSVGVCGGGVGKKKRSIQR